MQSPKFRFKKADIEAVINVLQLKSRWKAKVRDFMRRQPIPDPIEHLDFHVALDANCTALAADVCSGNYIPSSPTRFLSEKSKGLCRQLVIPSVKDALVLQLLSDALWVDLRSKAPSKNAFYAPQDQGFAKATKGEISDYGPLGAFLSFQETIFGFTTSKQFIVVTDIANFYDCVSYDHLRNILADLSVAREHALDLLIFTLSHLLWQPDYMPRVQVGLPQMTLDAPRLLAHCFLFEVDQIFVKTPNVEYARYMDDMDIGVDDIKTAKRMLRDLDLALQTRQVRLNSGKTRILTEAEARRHFKITENNLLVSLDERVQAKLKASSNILRERHFVTYALSYGFKRKIFEQGNGEKILRRLLSFAREWEADVRKSDFVRIMEAWPGSRLLALLWWQSHHAAEELLEDLRDFVRSGEIVDDAALITLSNALVNARLPASLKVDLLIRDMTGSLDEKRPWELYAKIWILSKYGTSADLMRIVESNVSTWATNEHLSRLVAGLYPRFLGTAQLTKFDNILARAGNAWTRYVRTFLGAISETASGYKSVKPFITAPNPSQPNKITHSKFLMLLALFLNGIIPLTHVWV